jgi:diaminopimelate decarboxylase
MTSQDGLPAARRDAAMRQAARSFGTPLYFYDRAALRRDAAALRSAFPDPWLRLYSLKANGLPSLIGELAGSGFGASAVSGGELSLAARAGFAPGMTALEGIGKTPADLRRAVALAAGGTPLLWVSLESSEEAGELARLARVGAGGHRIDVLVRVNPRVTPETHTGLAVGAAASKFGVLPEELGEVIAAGGGPDGPLRWRGIHVHVGSQLGAVDAWRSAFRVGLRVLGLQRAALPDADTLDAGSGFPVEYDPADPASVPPLELFAAAAREELEAMAADARPRRLAIEPGRVMVARAGWIVARVLHVRRREPAIVVLDAGMTELLRPALYGAEHPLVAITSLGRAVEPAPGLASLHGEVRVRLDGPVCESTDRLGLAAMPPLQRGDLVAIGVTGAYGSSMATTYNGRPRPAEVAWDGAALIALRRRGRIRSLP